MPERDYQPIVVNARDLRKALKRTAWSGEHGGVEDPDIFEPQHIGSAPVLPKVRVNADPHEIRLITINSNTALGMNEVTDLIDALQEARDYLETHQKEY